MKENATGSDSQRVKTMFKLSGTLMFLANMAIMFAMLAAIAAQASKIDRKQSMETAE